MHARCCIFVAFVFAPLKLYKRGVPYLLTVLISSPRSPSSTYEPAPTAEAQGLLRLRWVAPTSFNISVANSSVTHDGLQGPRGYFALSPRTTPRWKRLLVQDWHPFCLRHAC